MRSIRKNTICTATVLILLAATPALPQQIEPSAGGELFEKMQTEFADAYNRKDVPAMAAFFSENAVRITPAGIFRGREAIAANCKEYRSTWVFTTTALNELSRVCRATWFSTLENGKPDSVMANNITAIIQYC